MNYTDERFADIQMLRYHLNGFDTLSLQQKLYIYYLTEATLWGRDITFDQFGAYNLAIRTILETISKNYPCDKTASEYLALEEYLKRVWFSNGIYHHYGCEKFTPGFTETFFREAVKLADTAEHMDIKDAEAFSSLIDRICKVIFDKDVLPKRVNKSEGEDLIKTSACNYYQNVSQTDVEDFYEKMKKAYPDNSKQPSFGLNSTLIRDKEGDSIIHEVVWKIGGLYSKTIERIVENLNKAAEYAENEQQKKIIGLLTDYYTTGNLHTFDEYSIEWLKDTEGMVDFINGFIEVYGDPLGIKASWEGIVEYKDIEACERTQKICRNAQWFEDHSPVAPEFKKKTVKGVTANVICAAMLGGDEYPSTAIGINLPNADWIRAEYGSKSVTISNITQAYNEASKGSGFLDEFAVSDEVIAMVRKYGDKCDDLHTDLHECLGHGSGQLLPGTDPNALKNYSSTIEEARADLFGLYYIADKKLIELGLLPDSEAYKSQYYTYLMNGLLTQAVRITLGADIEEAHMRNRALIANWILAQSKEDKTIELIKREGKTYLVVNNYERVRELTGQLLAEIQRIKSEGDLEAARSLVENYGVKLDRDLHAEILERYKALDIAPYKGFINPRMCIEYDSNGNPTDVLVTYDEGYSQQMMRYSTDYSLEKRW